MGSDSRDSDVRDMSEKGLPPPASAANEAKGAGAGLHSSVYIGYVRSFGRVWHCVWGEMLMCNGLVASGLR